MTLPKPPSLHHLRTFTTTHRLPYPTTLAPRYTKGPPPYPYGPATHYKQSDSGLYGGAKIQFGNLISSQNAHKSRRVWRPNVHNKRLWSEGLGRFVRVKVLARVLRTIDKCGGLDGYLLGEKAGRVKELGVEGWRLRWMVMRTGRVRRRVRAVKEGMGLLGGGEKTAIQEEGRRGETVEDQVGIASSDIIDRIENAKAASFSEAETGTTLDPRPSSAPTSLQSHIAHTTFAIEAATARLSQPHSAEGTVPTDTTPSRRYTKSEKRAWRALRSTPAISPHSHNNNSAEPTPDEASLLLAEADRIETLVESEIMGMGAEERERVEVGMEMLRSGVQELEMRTGRVGKGMLGMGKEREKEGGGIVGRIKGFFSRRR